MNSGNGLSTLRSEKKIAAVAVLLMVSVVVGCGKPTVRFSSNQLSTKVIERASGVDEGLSRDAYQQIADILVGMFGTPDEPFFIADADAETEGFVDEKNLIRAAGPVTGDRLSDEVNAANPHLSKGAGLYRQHCVHCHGVTGNGKGPTASFLNPYPRDFTMGKYKFNSTIIGVPSSTSDLHRILMMGIDGTAMPSFALLDRGEVEALVDYVKYLSVRGQVERLLVEQACELDEGEKLDVTKENLVDDVLAGIVDSWKSAEPPRGQILDPDDPESLMDAALPTNPQVPLFSEDRAGWSEEKSEKLFASIDRGRDLYFTVEANCYSCHGPTQLGDGNLGLYDDWSKELVNWQTEQDDDGSKLEEHLSLGGLEPRIIRPRNLRLGEYRGGRRPIDIFWRIHNGIDGAGMPAATIKNPLQPTAKGLTYDDIWDLVNFVLALPYETQSRPGLDLPTNGRIRL